LNRLSHRQLWRLLVIGGGLSATLTTRADVVSAVQLLRESGCGGIAPVAQPLHRNALLDRAAAQWAAGRPLAAAAEHSGYDAEATSALHVSGPESSAIQMLRRSGCRTVSDPSLHDIGVYRRGLDTWLVLASAYVVPPSSQAPVLATRALTLVNQVRARGTRCGGRAFGPAPPVRLSGTLAGVAFGHAADIAYGPKTAEEVVQGWLDSPGHCENIMDPRFAEMGIAYAAGHASRRGVYWVQLLAAPRA
jgi:hypothetical protein